MQDLKALQDCIWGDDEAVKTLDMSKNDLKVSAESCTQAYKRLKIQLDEASSWATDSQSRASA